MTPTPTARRVPGFAFAATLLASVLGLGVYYDRASEAATAQALSSLDRDLAREGWSPEVRQMAAWAIRTNDHQGLPFVVIDQTRARLFAFSGEGRLTGSAPVLSDPLGAQASAPAGRFVADKRRSARLGTIVWANEHDVLSLDPAPPASDEHEPLAAAYHHHHAGSALHVPGEFYREHLDTFSRHASIAYVLPGEPGVHHNQRGYAADRAAALAPPRSST